MIRRAVSWLRPDARERGAAGLQQGDGPMASAPFSLPRPSDPQDLRQWIALARIKRPEGRDSYRMTYGGDGLEDLPENEPVALYFPRYKGSELKQILASVQPHPRSDGRFAAARLQQCELFADGRGRVRLRRDPEQEARLGGAVWTDEDLKGAWICVRRDRLAELLEGQRSEDGEAALYFFQIQGMPVYAAEDGEGATPVAEIVDYLETGAHGVLTLRLLRPAEGSGGEAAANSEVLVPYLPEFIEADLHAGRATVRRLPELLP